MISFPFGLLLKDWVWFRLNQLGRDESLLLCSRLMLLLIELLVWDFITISIEDWFLKLRFHISFNNCNLSLLDASVYSCIKDLYYILRKITLWIYSLYILCTLLKQRDLPRLIINVRQLGVLKDTFFHPTVTFQSHKWSHLIHIHRSCSLHDRSHIFWIYCYVILGDNMPQVTYLSLKEASHAKFSI